MKKINILYIETGLGFGGAVTCLYSLLKGLNRDKYNPIVISSHNDSETKKLVEDTGTRFMFVNRYQRSNYTDMLIRKTERRGAFLKNIFLVFVLITEKIRTLPFFLKVIRIAKKNKVDIIHLNNGINTSPESIIAAKLLEVPCICHVRGPIYNSPEARAVARHVNLFISVSKFLEKSILDVGGTRNNTNTIYDGIDLIECEKKRSCMQNEKIQKYKFGQRNIGLFSCLMGWKGHAVFIKAIEILVKKHGVKDCMFFIVGDIPQKNSSLRKELEAMVRDLDISDQVVFTGYQDNVYQFIDRMDIVVHTSTAPEPFGMVIIEAMALGKPVIATEIGGPLEIIDNGINGILILENNPQILAKTIYSLLQDNKKLAQISKNARETVRERFPLDKYIRNIEAIYDDKIVERA